MLKVDGVIPKRRSLITVDGGDSGEVELIEIDGVDLKGRGLTKVDWR